MSSRAEFLSLECRGREEGAIVEKRTELERTSICFSSSLLSQGSGGEDNAVVGMHTHLWW